MERHLEKQYILGMLNFITNPIRDRLSFQLQCWPLPPAVLVINCNFYIFSHKSYVSDIDVCV